MVKKGDYTINTSYGGGYSTFDSNSGEFFSGYHVNAGSLGITTDPRNANQLAEVSSKLASGAKHIELSLVTPHMMDSIPKQQFKEINRLSKLIGTTTSVHGPVINTTGIERDNYSETNREASERRILNTLERSQELDPKGNIKVVFHAGEGLQSSQWKDLGSKEKPREAKMMLAVERESGKVVFLEHEKKYYPGGVGGEIKEQIHTPEENLKMINATDWDNKLNQIEYLRGNAETILKDINPVFRGIFIDLQTGRRDASTLSAEEYDQVRKIYTASEYMHDAEKSLNGLFSKAYQIAQDKNDTHTLNKLKDFSKQYSQSLGIDEQGKRIAQSVEPSVRSSAVFGMIQQLKEDILPESYVPLEQFATEQSSKTYGNAAFESFKKFKDNSPTVIIENPPAGFILSTGEDLANLVEASRKQFVNRAVSEGISESDAKRQAEKLIGAAWDVGHINMLRAQGFSDKDIIKETEKIAKYVKHVHLSDNFGYEHTELPMGMGNVPFKEIMNRLGEKGFEAKKIIEAGDWWNHFKTNPVKESFEGMGSAIYSDGVGPYWNQTTGFQQNYSSGYGMFLPSINYETFGAGFSRLPSELGGVTGSGAGGRMGGGRE